LDHVTVGRVRKSCQKEAASPLPWKTKLIRRAKPSTDIPSEGEGGNSTVGKRNKQTLRQTTTERKKGEQKRKDLSRRAGLSCRKWGCGNKGSPRCLPAQACRGEREGNEEGLWEYHCSYHRKPPWKQRAGQMGVRGALDDAVLISQT